MKAVPGDMSWIPLGMLSAIASLAQLTLSTPGDILLKQPVLYLNADKPKHVECWLRLFDGIECFMC